MIEIEGAVGSRNLVSRPEYPEAPPGLDLALKQAEVELEFTVEPQGSVSQVEAILSSVNPELDLIWMRYLRRWQFSALDPGTPQADQKGRVRFRFEEDTKE